MTTIFIDTNTLLHAKPLQDVRWEEHEQPPVTIIITRPVIKELDEHKDNQPKRHLRERARKALQRIETATTNAGLRPGVTLKINNRQPRIAWEEHDLDQNSPDDQLIASIIEYQQQHPGEAIILYSHDVGPRLTAQHLGITAKPIPDEDRLPPQKDETEKELDRVRQELNELKTASPQLSIRINEQGDTLEIEMLAPPPVPLDDAAIDRQSVAARDKLADPRRTAIVDDDHVTRRIDLAMAAGFTFGVTPASEYERYERQKAEYREQYRDYLRALHEARDRRSRTIKLDLELHNNGGKPAEDITVTLITPDNVAISEHAPFLPSAPQAPALPRTQAEFHMETLQRVITPEFPNLYNPLPDINPWRSGPKVNGNHVRWWFKILNHRFTHDLGTLYLEVQTPTPFTIAYDIHAANSVKPFTGTIVIKPAPATEDNE